MTLPAATVEDGPFALMQPPRVPVLPSQSPSSTYRTSPAVKPLFRGHMRRLSYHCILRLRSEFASLQLHTQATNILMTHAALRRFMESKHSFRLHPLLRLGPKNSYFGRKRTTRCSASKVRGYRGIEAVDRRILDFRGTLSSADEWLVTCRAYIIQQIVLFTPRWICGVWAADEGHLPRPVLHPAGQSSRLPRRCMPLQFID